MFMMWPLPEKLLITGKKDNPKKTGKVFFLLAQAYEWIPRLRGCSSHFGVAKARTSRVMTVWRGVTDRVRNAGWGAKGIRPFKSVW